MKSIFLMLKSTHEETLSQQLQTKIKQFKCAVTFLTDYKCIFDFKSQNI